MAINLLHYSTGNDDPTWGVVRGNTVLPLPGEYATTADVLHQGAGAARTLLAESGKPGIPLAGLTYFPRFFPEVSMPTPAGITG